VAVEDPRSLGSWSSPEVQSCPFPFLSRLQEEAPVYLDPGTGFYMVTRYKDIGYAADHPEIFSSRAPVVVNKRSPVADEMRRRYEERGFPELFILSFDDPPTHRLHRSLVDRVFTPAYIRGLEPYLIDLTNELIDAFVEKGSVNLHREFSVKLPMSVIADQLGVDRADYEDFRVWSEAWNERHDPNCTPERELLLTDRIIDMQNYLHVRARRYLETPADNLLSRLAHAEVDGQRLTMTELMNIAQLLLVAGNETTTTALSTAMYLLLKNPEIKQSILSDVSLVSNFIEESLRRHAPVPHLYRITTQDTTLGGVNIPKGAIVQLFWMGGNYDKEQFEKPECLNVARKGVRNHMSFGRGIHFCVGNPLARGEMRIAIPLLLERLEDLRLSDVHPEPKFAPHFQIHCLDHLQVQFSPGKKLRA
jgi:cytochrome P450